MSKSRIEPYVSFPGNAAEAIAFYEKMFDAEKMFLSQFKDLPEGSDDMDGDPDHILHVTLQIGETPLMISDDPGPNFRSGNQIALTWSTDDNEELDRVWNRFVEAGSQVEMELEPAFFSPMFGVLKDPYGIQWMLMMHAENEERRMNRHSVYGSLTAQAGKGEELLGYLLEAASEMEQLDTCYCYIVGVKDDEPDIVYVFEVWDSPNAHQASLSIDVFANLIAKAKPIIVGMDSFPFLRIVGGKAKF